MIKGPYFPIMVFPYVYGNGFPSEQLQVVNNSAEMAVNVGASGDTVFGTIPCLDKTGKSFDF